MAPTPRWAPVWSSLSSKGHSSLGAQNEDTHSPETSVAVYTLSTEDASPSSSPW